MLEFGAAMMQVGVALMVLVFVAVPTLIVCWLVGGWVLVGVVVAIPVALGVAWWRADDTEEGTEA